MKAAPGTLNDVIIPPMLTNPGPNPVVSVNSPAKSPILFTPKGSCGSRYVELTEAVMREEESVADGAIPYAVIATD